jgi:hypothetical protein
MQASLPLAVLLLTSNPVALPEPITERIVVQEYGPAAPGSGVFAMYRDITALSTRGEPLTLVVLWLGGDQKLPEVGAVCEVQYRVAPLVGRVDKEGRPVIRKVVDNFDCLPAR